MNNPLGVIPSKGNQGTPRGKEKIFWPRWESNPRPTFTFNSPYCLPNISYFYISLNGLNRFPELSRTSSHFPGLSSPGKCHNKIPGLSRFSRTGTNPVKNLCLFASNFDLDQSECKSSQVSTSAHKVRPNRLKKWTQVFNLPSTCKSIWSGLMVYTNSM